MNKKILVLGPGRKTRGGITSVIKAHEQSEVWKKWNCQWIETYIDRSSSHKILFFIKSLFQFFIALPHAQLIHIHFSGSTSTKRKSVYFKIAKFFSKPIILHFHAFSPDDTILGSSRKIYLNLFQDANAIIALSNIWKLHIAQVVNDSSKIKVIYNPCPIIPFTSKGNKEKTILFAGTINKRKGYADLIKAYSLIAKQHTDWKLVFAGNGEIEIAQAMTKELNIEKQVHFKGWLSGSEKNDIFSNASIFCLPSYAEGFPMAVLDAWAYGLPVVTTPVGGLPDIIEHYKNALIFEPGDINSMAKYIEELINDDILRKNLSNASIKLSRDQFNIDTISDQLDQLYSANIDINKS